MNKRIDVPGVGIVEFPETMSDEQITNAIRTNIMPKYSAQMERPLQTFGRSAASLADTALNTLTGTMDIGARALARAYHGGLRGKSTEEAERLAQQEGTSPKDIVGRAFGVTGTPGYETAPLRQLGTYAGETIGQNVIQPLASATGLPEGYVGDVVNLGTAAVAPAIPKVAKVAATPITETAAGFRQGLAQPTYQRGAGSSFVPLQEKFYPSKQVDPFMKATPEQRVAMLPELEASQKPSSSLFTSTPGMLARNLGPKAEGQTLVPYRGETFRAFGEQLARDISDRPLVSGGLGLGGAVLGGLVGGIPGALIGGAIAPGVRAGQLGSISTLGRTARFSRGFPEALGEAQATAGRQMMTPGPVAPQLGYNPNPVIAASTQPRSVNIEGQSYNLPYQINTSQAQTARAPQTATPVPDLAQLAAQRSAQEAARSSSQVRQTAAQQVTGPVDPTGILAQIRARGQQPAPAPAAPAPAPAPAAIGSLFDPQNFNKLSDKDKLSVLRQKLAQEPQQTMTPAQEKAMRGQMTESSKTFNQEIINDFATKGNSDKLNMSTQTIPLDDSRIAYNNSNVTVGQARFLIKNGIDSIPVLEGMTESQVINAIYNNIKPKKKGPSNVSQMLVGEPKDIKALEQSLVSKRQFNEDLQKYRYGTEKNPLTVDEAVHLLESDFLPKQELVDNMMGRKTDLTEYSIWYRDENGKAQNVQTYGGELKKIR